MGARAHAHEHGRDSRAWLCQNMSATLAGNASAEKHGISKEDMADRCVFCVVVVWCACKMLRGTVPVVTPFVVVGTAARCRYQKYVASRPAKRQRRKK